MMRLTIRSFSCSVTRPRRNSAHDRILPYSPNYTQLTSKTVSDPNNQLVNVMADIKTTFDPKLEKLKTLLGNLVASGEDTGASITVDIDGQTVVDIWGDYIDEQQVKVSEKNTIVNVWSSTKMILSLTTLILVDRGLLDVNEKVSKYWPEFVAKGKDNIEVRQFIAHNAGISGRDNIVTIEVAYELVRRTDGRSLEQFIAEEIIGQMGTDIQRRLLVERQQEEPLQRRLRPLMDVQALSASTNDHTKETKNLGSDRCIHTTRLYPETVPPHQLHPNTRDFSVVDQGSIGKALVTHRPWCRGDFMARFDGMTVPEVMLHTLQKSDRVHLWDPYFIGNLAHSCNPNVMLDMAEPEMWAVQDIEAGTVLSMDYASTEDRLFRTFQCGCNSPGCRGEVTGRKQRSRLFADTTGKTA